MPRGGLLNSYVICFALPVRDVEVVPFLAASAVLRLTGLKRVLVLVACATTESVAHATKTKTLFSPVSRKTAEAAKKGTTSTSRTGKAKQITYEFNKPPRGIYVKVHPSPSYHTFNLPVFVNETE